MVCGILGWTVLPLIGAILAIVLGYVARGQIKRRGGAVVGSRLAAAGLVLGYTHLGLAIAGTLAGALLAFLGVALPLGMVGCGLCTGL
jgi:hypothetical protein